MYVSMCCMSVMYVFYVSSLRYVGVCVMCVCAYVMLFAYAFCVRYVCMRCMYVRCLINSGYVCTCVFVCTYVIYMCERCVCMLCMLCMYVMYVRYVYMLRLYAKYVRCECDARML